MISAFFGLMGSGKSCWLVEVILKALAQGRPVITNLPLNLEEFPEHQRELIIQVQYFDKDKKSIPEDWAHAGVHVVDEIWRYFPAGESPAKIDDARREWVTLHRHRIDSTGRSSELYVATQSPSQIAPFLRELIEQSTHLQKARGLGFSNLSHFRVCQGVKGETLRTGKKRQTKDVWKYYKSHDEDSEHAEGSEIHRTSVWRNWMLYVGAVGFVLVAVQVYRLPQIFKLGASEVEAGPVSVPAATVPASPAPGTAKPTVRAPPPAPEAPISDYWRLSGWVGIKGRVTFFIAGPGGVRRLASGCRLAPEPECFLSGVRITQYSGLEASHSAAADEGLNPVGEQSMR